MNKIHHNTHCYTKHVCNLCRQDIAVEVPTFVSWYIDTDAFSLAFPSGERIVSNTHGHNGQMSMSIHSSFVLHLQTESSHDWMAGSLQVITLFFKIFKNHLNTMRKIRCTHKTAASTFIIISLTASVHSATVWALNTSTITSKSVPNTDSACLIVSCSCAGSGLSLIGSVTGCTALLYASLSFVEPVGKILTHDICPDHDTQRILQLKSSSKSAFLKRVHQLYEIKLQYVECCVLN